MNIAILKTPQKWLCLAALALPLLSGCGSAKDANKGNFEKAINGELGKQCIVLQASTAFVSTSNEFPLAIPTAQAGGGTSAEEAEKQNAKSQAPYEALVKVGLLSVSDGLAKQLWRDKEVPGKIYSLTDEGKKALRDPKSTVFCAGNYKVDEVVNFTEPGNAMGMTISEVKYTVRAVDVPAWAKNEEVTSAFPGFAKEIEDKSERRATMILQNDGWSANISHF